MDGAAARESIEVSLACNRSALTAVQQERQRALYRLLGADVEEVRELADGYTFRHSPDKSVLLAMVEFVANERLCLLPLLRVQDHGRARRRSGLAADNGRRGGQARPGGGDVCRRLRMRPFLPAG
jgi:hypothetical protein